MTDWMLDAGVWFLAAAVVIGVVLEAFFPPQTIRHEDWDTEDEL